MLELPATAPLARSRRHARLPGWLVLLLGSPKARVGLGIVLGMVLLGLLAPLLVPASKATEFSLLDARQHPSLHHLFGTTDQGTDVFAQVALGRAALAPDRRRRPARSRRSSRRRSASSPPTSAASSTTSSASSRTSSSSFRRFRCSIDITAFLHQRGLLTMIARDRAARCGRSRRASCARQALTLKNRDFVLAAKVAGESTRRIVFGELLPNMISRIAAAFVLVFYIAILVAAGPRVPRPRRPAEGELGRRALLGDGQLERAAGRVVVVRLPGARASGSPCSG